MSAPSTAPSENAALANIQSMVRACIQCGTCTGSCPNADQMDLSPRHMWRRVILGQLERIMASQTFILCSDCYTCTLRCPRGLPLTEAMERLKGIAFARQEAAHRQPRLFYLQFLETVRRHGRIHEMDFMRRYFSALKSPTVPLSFAPLGLKLMGKGKVELGFGKTADTPLTPLFDRVAQMDRATMQNTTREEHSA
ncbi:hypothetical protein JCM12296A_07990 [Desulfosarcina cetonica]|uniref:4Fe-4S dicluster domain-containing protein n=1 Tax=Desulfosarcina cetonica TaxID=90730 RepID=UPI0006CF33C7|nr:4Fe-4S dicluster domain-containing protein [Desulfosarcina cetonica]